MPSRSKALPILLTLVILILVFVAMVIWWPIGPDYYYTFRPIALSFWSGRTHLFDGVHSTWYLAPWAMLLLAPLALLPLKVGQALLLMASLAGILFAMWAVRDAARPRQYLLGVILALTNLHTFDLLIRGNVDGFSALGVGLGWMGAARRKPWLLGAGLWLLSMKPVNVLLVIWLFACLAWRWSWREKLAALLPLLATLLVCAPIFGLDWPVRYIISMQRKPPFIALQTSLWRAFEFFGLPGWIAYLLFFIVLIALGLVFWYKKRDTLALALALAANLFFSPYTLGSHYVLLAPAFVVLVQKRTALALTWLLTLLPLLRLIWGRSITWIDGLYPLVLMIAAGVLYFRSSQGFGSQAPVIRACLLMRCPPSATDEAGHAGCWHQPAEGAQKLVQ